MLSENRVVITIMSLLLLVSNVTVYAQEQSFEGVWIRSPTESKNFDPFTPDFVMIDRIGAHYLVVFVNSIIEGDRVLAESFHHLYRLEAATLISTGTRLSRISTLHLTSSDELVEIIEIPEIGESGENIYVRPTIGDFASMVEWYGYDLDK
ncbi:hypothetical protein [Spirochaeta africana]|uniref:Uncharacterized protein n=1 Tax=Spirochaeta africana (strain ATCC 700263 / DSM 8902 / Z-7692) TaxID=889378 RepID=H9UIH9_SPIAZ|nr:hypothetical protein [Spirochaeta africana]AFG37322.1 hypothetical protein Spiaf_1245 [Spirochaeta africana DSM 8902]